jgi:hypothetical protein
MAEKGIMMKEIVDPIYQLHRGENAESIEGSLRFDRKTIRQPVNCSRTWSFIESTPPPRRRM